MKGDYIVMSRSLHRSDRKFDDILTKNLYSRKEELGRQSRRELSNERVADILRSDWTNQSSLRNTSQKEVDKKGNNNPSKDTSLKRIISAFYFLGKLTKLKKLNRADVNRPFFCALQNFVNIV